MKLTSAQKRLLRRMAAGVMPVRSQTRARADHRNACYRITELDRPIPGTFVERLQEMGLVQGYEVLELSALGWRWSRACDERRDFSVHCLPIYGGLRIKSHMKHDIILLLN